MMIQIINLFAFSCEDNAPNILANFFWLKGSEIFNILKVQGFSKTKRPFPTISKFVRRLTKTPGDFGRRSGNFRSSQENHFAPVSFLQKSYISGKELSFFFLYYIDFSVIAHIFRPSVRKFVPCAWVGVNNRSREERFSCSKAKRIVKTE